MPDSPKATERRLSVSSCHICCHESDLFCIGACDHPICFECGVRMRIICESNECPICRADVKIMLVVAGEKMTPYSSYERARRLIVDANFQKKYGLKFENAVALNAVRDILAHVCTVCESEPEFANFAELSQHMRRVHELYYCDLCVSNLQLFSWERKCYSREQLAKHRRIGDPDDRSHRGHPLCDFCDERYVDDEHLYRHLRRDHFFCHFCDADGTNMFYASSNELKKHLKSNHFLCEEGQCRDEPLGIAFRHDIDFKAHKATVHRDKQERVVNLDFGLRRGGTRDRPSVNQEIGQKPGRGSKPTRGKKNEPGHRYQRSRNDVDADGGDDDCAAGGQASAKQKEEFDLKTDEFPSLKPGSAKAPPTGSGVPMVNRVKPGGPYRPGRSGSFDKNDFPSLPSAAGKKNDSKRTARRKSRSCSPPKKNIEKNYVMIDDDEPVPSVSDSVKSAWAAEAAKSSQKSDADNKKAKQQKDNTKWNPKPAFSQGAANGSSASAWQTKSEVFPALASAGSGKPTRSAEARDLLSKPWSQLILTENEKAQRKNEKAPLETTRKQKKAASSSMATDALLEALPAGLPAKSKARRVAQKKQRPSECLEEDTATESDWGMVSLNPPPGFENVHASCVPPPPGFQSQQAQPLPNGSVEEPVGAADKPQSYLYTKPTDFDLRNRALFDRLCAAMGNDESSIQAFKMASSQYRRGELDASTYWKRILSLLGDEGVFRQTFNELVCLLPDIDRQNALWNSYISDAVNENGRSLCDAVKPCLTCRQLLVKMDYYEHAQTAHQVKRKIRNKPEEEYPPLH